MSELSRYQVLKAIVYEPDKLLSYPHVHGVAVGFKERGERLTQRPSVKVYVRRKVPRNEQHIGSTALIPPRWPILVPAGRGLYKMVTVPTDVVRVARTHRASAPVAVGPGMWIGREAWPPGTIGCVVERNNRRFLLTAAHLFANFGSAGPPTEPVVAHQPPTVDKTTRFGSVEAVYYGNHEVHGHIDAALVLKRIAKRKYTIRTPFPECPRFRGVAPESAWASTSVAKVGAQTKYTAGSYSCHHAATTIGHYPATDILEYTVPAGAPDGYKFALRGDSGAAVVTVSPVRDLVIGLLVGASNDGLRGYVVPLPRILELFGVELTLPKAT